MSPMYYLVRRVLQGVLLSCQCVANRTTSCAQAKAAELATNQSLQQALLLCALELTSFSITGIASFPSITAQLGLDSAALDIWEAAELFLHHLPLQTSLELPECVSSYLLFVRVRTVEQLAWQPGSSVYEVSRALQR